jgi:hypothetical protein
MSEPFVVCGDVIPDHQGATDPQHLPKTEKAMRLMFRTHSLLPAILIAARIIPIAAVSSPEDAASDTKQAWQPLFNGKDLAAWTVKCRPADKAKTFWRVDEGTILADSIGHKGHDYVWLLTDKEYKNFVLQLKFRMYRDSPGNSGVQIRSRYDDEAGWLDGPQVDINPPGPWRTGMIWDETRGNQRWLFPKVPKGEWVDKSMANPKLTARYSDEGDGWNDLEITARGMKLRAVLNEVCIMEYDGEGTLNDALHKSRNVGERGHIALQIHTGDQLRIRFKDIRILPLGD